MVQAPNKSSAGTVNAKWHPLFFRSSGVLEILKQHLNGTFFQRVVSFFMQMKLTVVSIFYIKNGGACA